EEQPEINQEEGTSKQQNIFVPYLLYLLPKMDQQQQLQQQLQDENQTLQQQVAQLTAQVALLQAHAAPPPSPHRKCPEAVPDKFSGQPEMFPAFMGQCQLFMAMRPKDFTDDRAQVGFVISLLSGSATRWATPLLFKNSPLLTNYQGFWQHMRHIYEDPMGPLQEFISEFWLLCLDSNWNDAALMDAFQDATCICTAAPCANSAPGHPTCCGNGRGANGVRSGCLTAQE
uniref:DUF4939 domain-containing protein n=1 Tax=Pseudonaja textilis TaxID=8673 RepID=A0A670YV68_PSETE